MKVKDIVQVVRLRPKSEEWAELFRINFVGKEGEVVQILGTPEEPCQGVRVRFPSIRKGDFEMAFYIDEVKKIDRKHLRCTDNESVHKTASFS